MNIKLNKISDKLKKKTLQICLVLIIIMVIQISILIVDDRNTEIHLF